MQLFNNCYTYNPPHYGVVTMAKELETFMLNKLKSMPSQVITLSFLPGSHHGLRELLQVQSEGGRCLFDVSQYPQYGHGEAAGDAGGGKRIMREKTRHTQKRHR